MKWMPRYFYFPSFRNTVYRTHPWPASCLIQLTAASLSSVSWMSMTSGDFCCWQEDSRSNVVRTRLDHSQLTRALEIGFCGAASSKFFQKAFFNRSCKGPRLACGTVCLVNGCLRRKVIDTVHIFRGGNTSLASQCRLYGSCLFGERKTGCELWPGQRFGKKLLWWRIPT